MSEQKPKKRKLKGFLILTFPLFCCVVYFGAREIIHSKNFVLKKVSVEIEGFVEDRLIPISSEEITSSLGLKLEEDSLLTLDLNEMRERVLTHNWVKEALLWKEFPSTLRIKAVVRSPSAILQSPLGDLFYYETEGGSLLKVDTKVLGDLPLVVGVSGVTDDQARFKRLKEILDLWNASEISKEVQIQMMQFLDSDRVNLLVKFYDPSHRKWMKTEIQVSQRFDELESSDLLRLSRVLEYLSARSVVARKIFLADRKKIVVKTTRGS